MVLSVVFLFLVATVAHAQKMVVDVDKNFDFTTFKSFAWAAGANSAEADDQPNNYRRC